MAASRVKCCMVRVECYEATRAVRRYMPMSTETSPCQPPGTMVLGCLRRAQRGERSRSLSRVAASYKQYLNFLPEQNVFSASLPRLRDSVPMFAARVAAVLPNNLSALELSLAIGKLSSSDAGVAGTCAVSRGLSSLSLTCDLTSWSKSWSYGDLPWLLPHSGDVTHAAESIGDDTMGDECSCSATSSSTNDAGLSTALGGWNI
ncbi:hypothetical protein F444_02219 [Phytophthora nicotianae P1976]|uniref:Uncharacterized protein n=1 Tax=Phytophthora nicotianae P1976 TaxID=1317066 RepID=A0A081AY61_PHYNI|nr:hypothetical protein F444_02219 [Phytophthora nicotianae P1976]